MDGAEIAQSARWTEAASQWSSVAILAHLRTLNVSRFRLSEHQFFTNSSLSLPHRGGEAPILLGCSRRYNVP